jgi:hypothetical protein
MARRIAIQTQTSLVVSRKYGKLVRLTANRLKKQAEIMRFEYRPGARFMSGGMTEIDPTKS